MSRSTADAELNSLSEGLHEELLPAVQLLRPLLDALAPTPVVRETIGQYIVAAINKGYSVKLLARTP